jgi:benzodiazapine receptor
MRRLRYLAAVVAAAGGGGAATQRSVDAWYRGLDKPSWTPPSAAFGPVWTLLYAQMAYSAARVARTEHPGREVALRLWWGQLALNAAWSPVFFGARRIGAGAVVVGALVPAVAATAAASSRVDRTAGRLYLPYLAWSSYAAALNVAIWRRNRG